ncbi:hypothetical protein D3C85_274410 [compost metagenome]
MQKDNGGPAFPLMYEGSTRSDNYGMTMRDYFAAKAMQAIRSKSTRFDDAGIAQLAYAQADAMLKERAK